MQRHVLNLKYGFTELQTDYVYKHLHIYRNFVDLADGVSSTVLPGKIFLNVITLGSTNMISTCFHISLYNFVYFFLSNLLT